MKIIVAVYSILIAPVLLSAQINPDTVYSEQVTTHTTVAGFDLPGAQVTYTLNDTVNNTFLEVASGLSDDFGEYVLDSLPVLKHSTGINPIQEKEDQKVIVTNNSQGSNHLIRIISDENIAKEGYIINMLGQVVETLPLEKTNNNIYTAVWNGQDRETGMYIFTTRSEQGNISEKIDHIENVPSIINYSAGLNSFPEEKSSKATLDGEAISRYIRTITSPFTEAYEDTVYVHEDMQHYFEAELEHLPITPSSMQGQILVNGEFPAYNANIQIKNLTDESIIYNIQTDENGNYSQDDMPVPIDALFTNPEDTEYEVTTTAADPNNFEEEVELITLVSGENLLHNINVEANPIDPGSLTGTILVNGEFPAYNATIHVENSNDPSINFDFTTDENGNFSQDDIPIPLDALFTAPETSQYQLQIQAQNPNNWQGQTDNITITSNQNLNLDIDVEANPIDPGQVSGQVLLDGETPIANANLHWKNLSDPSITYDFETDAQGEYEEDVSVPLDALFTAPETTQYEVTTSGDNLETMIDTFLVTSGQQAINNILVFPVSFDDATVQALLRYEDDNQGVPFANVEYKQLNNQSQVFSTNTTTNGAYTFTLPIIYEPENPGETSYIVTYTPSENTDPPFFTKIDTVLLSSGANNFIHYVTKNIITPTQDIEGIVKDVYTKEVASGITVRLIDQLSGEVLEEDITGTDGAYLFEDIEAGSQVEFELGSESHFWVYNTEYSVPQVPGDTIVTFNRLAYPKQVEVPVDGTNYTILGEGEEVSEMVGTDKVSFEEILRNEDNMHPTNPLNQGYVDALQYIQNNFMKEIHPSPQSLHHVTSLQKCKQPMTPTPISFRDFLVGMLNLVEEILQHPSGF